MRWQATVSKFIELVKKRKEGGTGLVNTLETKRAMQRAMQQLHEADPREEEEEQEEEEEEEIYTIMQDGQQVEFKVGAACQVLYDDGASRHTPHATCLR